MAFKIADGYVDVDARTDTAHSKISRVIAALTLFAPAAQAATGAVAAGVGGMTAAFGAAGIAVGAFALAAIPQLKRLKGDMSKLPPATRAMARELNTLKREYIEWSDALAKDTMPVFAKGIQILRRMLPSLTPLVKTASKAFFDWLDQIYRAVKGGAFDSFMKRVNETAKQVLPDLLASVTNVGKGLAGMFNAFLPFAPVMSAGLENLTAKFAAWGQSLGKSQAFTDFMNRVRENAPVLLSILGNLIEILGKIAPALLPLTGISLTLINTLTGIIAALPPQVLTAIATAITTIVLAMRAWAVVQGVLNVLMAANPVGIVVLALAALAAGLYLAWTRSQTFRNIVIGAWHAIQQVVSTAWHEVIQPVLARMGEFLQNTIIPVVSSVAGAFGAIGDKAAESAGKIAGMNLGIADTKTKSSGVVGWLRSNWQPVIGLIIAGPVGMAVGLLVRHWGSIRNTFSSGGTWVSNNWRQVWEKMKAIAAAAGSWLVNKAATIISNIGNALLRPWPGLQAKWNAGFGRLMAGLTSFANRATSFMSGLPGRLRRGLGNLGGLLYGAGQAIIRGLISGMTSMIGQALSTISGLASRLRSYLPFSPAKEGPFSGSGAPELSGRAIVSDMAKGMAGEAPHLASVMAGLLGPVAASAPALAPVGAVASGGMTIGSLIVNVKAVLDPSDPAARRKLVAELREALRELEREYL